MDSPIWGTTYVGERAISEPDFAALRARGDPAAMLTTDLLAERSFPCGARARSTSSRRRANRRPPGPGTPESRERGNASAGEGRIGCAMTRATRCAAVPTDCGRARKTCTAATPHVGATPHVLPHVRPLSRSLAPSERSSPDEPRRPRRGRQCRDNQRRPTVAGRIITHPREERPPRAMAQPSDRRPHRARPAPEPRDAVAVEAAEDDRGAAQVPVREDRPVPMEPSIPMERSERPVPMQPPRAPVGRRPEAPAGGPRRRPSVTATPDDGSTPVPAPKPRTPRPSTPRTTPKVVAGPKAPTTAGASAPDTAASAGEGDATSPTTPKRRRRRGGRGRGGGGGARPAGTTRADDDGSGEASEDRTDRPAPSGGYGRGRSASASPPSTRSPRRTAVDVGADDEAPTDSTAATQRDDAIPDPAGTPSTGAREAPWSAGLGRYKAGRQRAERAGR